MSETEPRYCMYCGKMALTRVNNTTNVWSGWLQYKCGWCGKQVQSSPVK